MTSYFQFGRTLFLSLLFAAVVFWGTGSVGVARADAADRALILIYHHLSDSNQNISTISPKLFEDHMRFLKENGYHVIPMKQLKEFLLSKSAGGESPQLPERSVVITFDDGYESFYQEAYPILKKYEFPATHFLIVGKVDKNATYANEIPKLTWKQVKEMIDSKLIDFQSHTWFKHHFVDGEAALLKSSAQEVETDLLLARGILENKTGKKVDMIAYPYGASNGMVTDVARKTEHQLGFSTMPGVVMRGLDLLTLPRLNVGYEQMSVQELAGNLGQYLGSDKDDNHGGHELTGKDVTLDLPGRNGRQ